MDFTKIFKYIPEVAKPEEKKLGFNTKLKWTLIVLAGFFVLANVPLFGLSNNALERFKYLAIILGTDFGSIISLGIGPIVMASIILQLLTFSGIFGIDVTTAEGKRFFQGIQKLFVFFFIIFESSVYVLMKGLEALPGFAPFLIFQLILGGIAIFYMDEVCQKWGFGSGVSLFIAAGVSWRIITSAFQFVNEQGKNCLFDFENTACAGKVLVMIQAISSKYPTEFLSALSAILATAVIFLIVAWAQSLKVEIPLSFGKIRGYGIKWPLSFFYSSVIPVILTAALVATLQLFGGLLQNWLGYATILGGFIDGRAVSGFAFWIGNENILDMIIRGSFSYKYIIQGITHVLFFTACSTLFAILWVKTAGMDSKTQAHKIAASGLQVAGFRQDERVLESILDRYIMPLTVMGGAAIGVLASITDLLGALVSGTAILLVIMIMFQFYQSIGQQHQLDMVPAMKKLWEKNKIRK
jgi:preprotein translocase subunit SecY